MTRTVNSDESRCWEKKSRPPSCSGNSFRGERFRNFTTTYQIYWTTLHHSRKNIQESHCQSLKFSELLISDPSGDFLVEAKSTLSSCRTGWCRETQLTTAIDRASPGSRSSGLIITEEPGYGVQYKINGQRAGSTSWRNQFDDHYEWILAVLTDSSQARPLIAFTEMQRFIVALASTPYVIPFLNAIDVSVGRDGHFIVRGRMTQAAYNGIIDAALRNGFYDIEPLIVIDSRALVYASPDQGLNYCL